MCEHSQHVSIDSILYTSLSLSTRDVFGDGAVQIIFNVHLAKEYPRYISTRYNLSAISCRMASIRSAEPAMTQPVKVKLKRTSHHDESALCYGLFDRKECFQQPAAVCIQDTTKHAALIFSTLHFVEREHLDLG